MADSDDDQTINFGSDLSIKACIRNCLDGECCECDHPHEEPDSPGGQRSPVPYQQHPTSHQSLVPDASSPGRGPSQPRPVVKQYQPAQSMQYDTASNRGGQDQPGTFSGPPGSFQDYGTGGVRIAGQYPSGFTTQASSYNPQAGADVTPFQQSMGYYRDGAGCLHDSLGQPINEQGVAVRPTASSMPQPSPTSGLSDQSFQTAPSHHSRSTDGGSCAGSGHSSQKGKHKKH